MRNKIASRAADQLSRFTQQLTGLCATYAGNLTADFTQQVNALTNDMTLSRISANDLQILRKNVIALLDAHNVHHLDWRSHMAKLLLREILARVQGDLVLSDEQRALRLFNA